MLERKAGRESGVEVARGFRESRMTRAPCVREWVCTAYDQDDETYAEKGSFAWGRRRGSVVAALSSQLRESCFSCSHVHRHEGASLGFRK